MSCFVCAVILFYRQVFWVLENVGKIIDATRSLCNDHLMNVVRPVMSSPSLRVAALAFALSSWVEGLTHLRTALLMPSLPGHDDDDAHEPPAPPNRSPVHASWRERIVAWVKRSGRRNVQMDDTERTSMGAVNIAVSFLSDLWYEA